MIDHNTVGYFPHLKRSAALLANIDLACAARTSPCVAGAFA